VGQNLRGSGLREHTKKIWDPCVSLQPLKLATSNLVHKLGLGLAYQKRLGPKLAGVWAVGAHTKIGTPYVLVFLQPATVFFLTVNLKFGTQIWFGTSLPKTTVRTKIGGGLG